MLLQVFGAENVQLNCKCVAVEQEAHRVTAILKMDAKPQEMCWLLQTERTP